MRQPMVQMTRMMQKANRAGAIKEGQPLAEWQIGARAKLEVLLGLPFERCEEQFRIEWQEEREGYTEYRLAFHTEEDFEMVANLRIPEGAAEKIPVVICLQGHSKGMHISLGQPLYDGDEKTIKGGDRDFSLQIVKKGFAALAMEQRGFGECGGTEKGPACFQPAMAALMMGRTLIGERVWDVSRAIDMLEKHFPQLDTERIALMGQSGGGTTTIYAAALETRIAAAMPSCAFSGFMPSIGIQTHCSCNYIPGIMNYFDMGDLTGMIAPRPLVIVNGQSDDIFPIDSASKEFEVTKKYYQLAGASTSCRHVIGTEGHRFYAQPGWKAFDELTVWCRTQK